LFFLVGFVTGISSAEAFASCLDEAADFAQRICGAINDRGKTTLVTTSGDLNAEAKGLIKQLLGSAGANFQGGATIKTYENVLQEQLQQEHFDQCAQNMAKAGIEQVCANKQGSDNIDRAIKSLIGDKPYSLGSTYPDYAFRKLISDMPSEITVDGNRYFVDGEVTVNRGPQGEPLSTRLLIDGNHIIREIDVYSWPDSGTWLNELYVGFAKQVGGHDLKFYNEKTYWCARFDGRFGIEIPCYEALQNRTLAWQNVANVQTAGVNRIGDIEYTYVRTQWSDEPVFSDSEGQAHYKNFGRPPPDEEEITLRARP